MEDDKANIDQLVKQRQNRASYRRSVSDTFTNGPPSPVTKSRIRNKKVSPVRNTGDSQSEEDSIGDSYASDGDSSSDYVSASEEFIDVIGDLQSSSEREVLQSEPSTSKTAEVGTASCCFRQTKHSGRKKRLKWRRKQTRAETKDCVPFCDTEDLNDFLGEFTEIVGGDVENSSRGVPLLSAFCLQVLCRRASRSSSWWALLPHSMHNRLKAEQLTFLNRAASLSYVGAVLDLAETKYRDIVANMEQFPHSYVDRGWHVSEDQPDKKKVYFHARIAATIWENYSQAYEPQGDERRLFYENFTPLPQNGRNTNEDGPIPIHQSVEDIHIFSAFTYYLSGFFGTSLSGHLMQAVDDQTSPYYLTVTMKVKNKLKKRYPTLVRWLFTEAVPYVWWARGNISQAEEAFLYLLKSRSLTTDIQRAFYMHEVARLYLHAEQYSKARRTFLAAADLCTTKVTRTESSIPLFYLQAHVLTAAGLDTGVLTVSHSREAIQAWEQVMQQEVGSIFYTSINAAVASVMCHHSGIAVDNNTWIVFALNWLNKFSSKFYDVRLALSLLYAIKGDEKKSTDAYRNYHHGIRGEAQDRGIFAHLPGQGWAPNPDDVYFTSSYNPWEALLRQAEAASKAGDDITIMRVIWRRQLCHFSLDSYRMLAVGDMDHKPVKLFFTPEGFLTGDIHLTTPPVQQVLLNPLTGNIEFTQSSSVPPLCCDVQSSCGVTRVESLYKIPQLFELYEGEESCLYYSESHTQSLRGDPLIKNQFIILRSADGSTSKLNIKRVVREHQIKATKAAIMSSVAVNAEETSSFRDELRKLLQKQIAKGFYVDMQAILDLFSVGKACIKSKNPKRPPRSKYESLFGIRLVTFRVLHDAVVLLYSLAAVPGKPSVIMIVNYSSSEKFLKPIILFRDDIKDAADRCFVFPAANLESMKLSKARLFGVLCKKHVAIYDNEGHLVSEESAGRIASHRNVWIARDHIITPGCSNDRIIIQQPATEEIKEVTLDTGFQDVKVMHGYCFIISEESLQLMDMGGRMLPWKIYRSESTLSEDETKLVMNHREQLQVLRSERAVCPLSDLTGPVYRVLVACGNHVLLLEVPDGERRMDAVHCVLDLEVNGYPTEACFVGTQGNFMVTASIFHRRDQVYSENLYYYNIDGRLVSLLPNLGHGPHAFLPVAHKGTHDLLSQYPDVPYSSTGWFIYMRDGHGAISCVFTPYSGGQQEL